jgi:uncharacterized membrane protein
MHLASTSRNEGVATSSTHTWLPLFGAVGFALILVGLVLTTSATAQSTLNDASEVIAANYVEHRDTIRLGISLALVGNFLTFFFLGYLRARLRSAAREDDWLGPVAFAGGVVVLAVLAAYLALLLAASNNSIGAAPELARTLFYLDWEYAGVFCPAFGALVGASSLGIVRGGVLPRRLRWLGWIGVPLAVALGLAVSWVDFSHG